MEPDVPAAVLRLFWDVDPAAIELDAHRDFVFERVMSRGSWEAMCWLRQRYPVEALAAFVSRDGRSKLSPRDLAYWSLVCGVDTPSEPGGGRPRWAASVEGLHSHERVDSTACPSPAPGVENVRHRVTATAPCFADEVTSGYSRTRQWPR